MLGYAYNGPLGGVDFMLAKVSQQGQVYWTRYLGTTQDDFGTSIMWMHNGDLLLAGTTHDPLQSEQVLLVVCDTAGTQLSQFTYGTIGTESVSAARACPDRGFLITGYQTNSGSNYSYMLKVDSLLNEEWSGAYGIGINDYASEGLMKSANSFFLSSDRRFNTGGGTFDYDISLIHADSTGSVLWDSVYHEDFQNGCQGIIESQAGHLLVFGETEVFQFSPFDFFIFAADTNGNLLWRKTFGGSGTNAMFDLLEDASGNLIGTGYSNSQSGGVDPINVALVKTDALGNVIWQREYGLPSIDIGYAILPSPDGGFLVAGRTTSANDEDFYLLKTDANGLITGVQEPTVPSNQLAVYPNPCHSECSFRAGSDFTGYRIIDASGKVVRSISRSGKTGSIGNMQVTGLAPGTYLLELIGPSGKSSHALFGVR